MTGLRERKREQNRASTADAAWRLFIERGYDNVTVADICAAADIAPRSFHRYFKSKEDVVAEPVRRMGAVVADSIADAPFSASEREVLRRAMLDLGRFTVANHAWLTGLRVVIRQSHLLRSSHLALRPDQEREIAAMLAARHGGAGETDWRLRLLAAVAIAAFRVWFDDYFRDELDDPIGRLEEMLHLVTSIG